MFVFTIIIYLDAIMCCEEALSSYMYVCALHRSVHNTSQSPMLCRVTLMLTLSTTQQNTRMDSDPILVFLCVAFLRLVPQNCKNFLEHVCVLASYCEPALYLYVISLRL